MTTRRIVVTGAGGFLGNQIARQLISAGHRVAVSFSRGGSFMPGALHSWTGPLPSPAFDALVRSFQPDWVVHCAGSSRVAKSFEDPQQDFRNNVLATRAVYQAVGASAPRAGVVFLSSAAVYGQPERLPVLESTPTAPLSPYGEHKLECERIGREYSGTAGISTLNLRIFSAYGPGLRKQVLFDLYRKACSGGTILLDGDGSEERDFVHVSDVARIVAWGVAQNLSGFETVNVASGSSCTIRELAARFLTALGMPRAVRFSGRVGPGTPRTWRVDHSKLCRLGLRPATSLETGLRGYADWLLQDQGVPDADRHVAAAG